MSVFQQLAELILAGASRRDKEYDDFMAFYRAIIETTDGKVAKEVGRVPVTVFWGGKEENWGIELTPTDYAFWKEKIAVGVRFKYSFEVVRNAIFSAMTKAAEKNNLTADERKQLLALLDQPLGA